MIRVGRNGMPHSNTLRSLEGKVLFARMQQYDGISYALQLTEDEMQTMRSVDVEYCVCMSKRVQEVDENPRLQTIPEAVQQMLHQYQYITKMMTVFSSL